MTEHSYHTKTTWTGNAGSGTSSYTAYRRDHEIVVPGKAPIAGSSDPAFRGDAKRYNPEELLVASLSTCHMLWFLHLSANAGVIVTKYEDEATGVMTETSDGGGHFTEVTLHPKVTVASQSNTDSCEELHQRAHELCFIAASVNFPVRCESSTISEKEVGS